MTVILIFCSLPTSGNIQFGHSRKCGGHRRPTSVCIGQRDAVFSVFFIRMAARSRCESKSCEGENVGAAFGIASQSPTVKALVSRFGGRHLESVVIRCDIDNVTVRSRTHYRKCGAVTVETMSVCHWKPKLHLPAEKILHGFEGGCPLSGLFNLQV